MISPRATSRMHSGATLAMTLSTDLFGDDYRKYRARVGMLVPWRRSA